MALFGLNHLVDRDRNSRTWVIRSSQFVRANTSTKDSFVLRGVGVEVKWAWRKREWVVPRPSR